MKKITLIAGAFVALSCFTAKAQSQADKAPNIDREPIQTSLKTEAIWDIQKSYDITSVTNNNNVGMAGVIFFNNEFWVSEWASDTIVRYTASGAYIDKFTIAGVTGIRSFSTDGTIIYAGTSSSMIYRINPSTKQLDAQPQITLATSTLTARYCAYDPTLDGGNGGFWVGSFGSDITSVSMSGQTLSVIPIATTGRSGIYGASVDYFTAGGPYLWIFDQGGTNQCDLVQLSLPSGTPTGVTHDVFPDISTTHSLATGLAGGAFTTYDIVAGTASIVCLAQGDPNNVIISYELGTTSFGFDENTATRFKVYPNPTDDFVVVSLDENMRDASYQLVDINGKLVREGNLENQESTIDVANLAAGTYVLQINKAGKNIGEQKIVKNK